MTPEEQKRVLIVDDEPNLAIMLATSLEALGEEYIFETAHNGQEALVKLEQNSYTLLITDYNMPGMTGMDLAKTVRQISPGTRVILMTAYGSHKLRTMIEQLRLDGYIDKPASTIEIREIVKKVVGHATHQTEEADPYRSGQRTVDDAINQHVNALQSNTGARCVLLISSGGYPISVMGATDGLDVSSISALVAANFLASVELANLLGSSSSNFKSSYYEGNDYNIYSYDINEDLLLAVIFGSESKPGVVWFYTKQTATTLVPLVADRPPQKFTLTDNNVEEAFDAGFDALFGIDEDDGDGASLFDAIQSEPATPQNNGTKQTPAQQSTPDKSKLTQNSTNAAQPLTFEQAVAAGLVPPQIVNRESK